MYNTEFKKRMLDFKEGVRTAKKPRWSNFPQQQYACCCPTMCMYRGDILSSTCKDCVSNGAAILDCQTCKCEYQTGIFLEKDIIPMATKKLCGDELKARERVPDKDVRAHNNFTQILLSSVQKGIESLRNSNSSLDKKNVLSATSGHMSRLQMPSKEELHSLQQNLPLTTRLLATGADVRHALNADPRKKGKRHHQNNLR